MIFFVNRQSASCTHVSALLHSLVAMTSKNCQVHPELPTSALVDGDIERFTPLTSVLSSWNVPRSRKESNLRMSEAVFEKHDYQRSTKRRRKQIRDFDPRPEDYRGNAKSLLPALLDSVRGESLGISVLFDDKYCQETILSSDTCVPSASNIQETVVAFKQSLQMSPSQLRNIEQSTREQRESSLWFSARRYRITASHFGEILHRRRDTPPDRLVLSILKPRKFSTPATTWGTEHEAMAIQAYIHHQHSCGRSDLTVGPCGFFVSEQHPFLGATPDGTVYDPTNPEQPFGFLEVKCPYSHRDRTPTEACARPGFCCEIDTQSDGSQLIKLRRSHPYYAQVQGQMAVGDRPWCDFVIYTKTISIERIYFDSDYWLDTLLPKLEDFFDNCLGPEIVSPLHTLGIPMRNLAK